MQYQEVATRWRQEEAFPESQAQPPTGGVAGPHGPRGSCPSAPSLPNEAGAGSQGCSESGIQLLPSRFHRVKAGLSGPPRPPAEGPKRGQFKLPRRVQRVQGEQGGEPPLQKRVSRLGWPQPPCTVTKLPKFSGRRGGWIRIADCSGNSLGTLLRATGHGTEGPSSGGGTVPHQGHLSHFQHQITFEHFY